MASGKDIVTSGQTWVAAKVPYVWGGVTKAGADCSGYVQNVLAGLGVNVGRTTYDQVKQGEQINGGLANAVPGDILFFGDSAGAPTHEGIYIGNGQMIDEPHSGATARQEAVWTNLVAVRRFSTDGDSVATPGLIAGTGTVTTGAATGTSSDVGDVTLLSTPLGDIKLGMSGVIRGAVIVAGIVFVVIALHALTSGASTPAGIVSDGATGAASNVGKVVRNKSTSGSSSNTVHRGGSRTSSAQPTETESSDEASS